MKAKEIVLRRMRSVGLSGPSFDRPEDVVRWLGAVQSQDYGPAKWSIGQRLRGAKDSDIDKAFDDGSILRTHVLRPTWHFVLPEDIRWMLKLTAPRVHAFNAYYYRQLGLDQAVLRKSRSVFVRALKGGISLTRKELAKRLEKAGIEAKGLRLGYIFGSAELDGLICSGPREGKQHTYALLDERAPTAGSLALDEALAQLTLRYFSSHGPATIKDFKWWSSLSVSDIKRGLEITSTKLEREDIDGVEFWYSTSAKRSSVESPHVHVLQGYDEYIVGYSESKYLLDPSGGTRSLPKGRTVFNGVVIMDGQVAGHWKRTLKKDSVLIEVVHYDTLNRAQIQAVQTAANGYGDFQDRPVTVVRSQI